MVNIVGISGSLREGSHTEVMVKTALKAAKSAGAKTRFIDLKGKDLPLCDGRKDYNYGPTVARIRKQLEKADAFIIGTPEYHGGYSGVLKNFLDLHPGAPFKGKMVALVGAAGGRLGADNAMNQLRTVFKNLESFCYNIQASATGGDFKDGKLTNDFVTQRLKDIGKGLVEVTQKLRPPQQKAS